MRGARETSELARNLEQLRVLMIAPSAVPGGMEEILFNLASSVPEFGVTPDVVSLQPGPLVDRLIDHSIDVEVLQTGRLRDARDFARTCNRLSTIMRARGVDAVYSNMAKAHMYAAVPAYVRRIPALWCQAGFPDPPHWLDRLATALPAAGVIALSRDAEAAQRHVNGRRNVHMLHPGIDLRRFRVSSDPGLRSVYGIPAEATLISIVGRLQSWKGQAEFLRAARLVSESHPDAYFAVVGGAILGWEGDYPEQLGRLVTELDIERRVTFTGHTPDVHRWMAASDVVVNASEPEPFGLVVIEAMASGCAVVALDGGGPRDIIENEESGLLCQSRDPRALAAPLARLLDAPDLRRRLGRGARDRVESKFSRRMMAEEFVRIIREAVSSVRCAHTA